MPGKFCSSYSSHRSNDHTHVVGAAAKERGFDEGFAGLLNVGQAAFEDLLDFMVAHHLPQAIGAEQHVVSGAHRFDEPVYLHAVLITQTAIDFIAVWMG